MLRARGRKRLFLPRFLKFAGSGSPCQGVHSDGSNARATAVFVAHITQEDRVQERF